MKLVYNVWGVRVIFVSLVVSVIYKTLVGISMKKQ